MSALPRTRVTEEEYLQHDLSHEGKHEYVNGEMWAMAGAHGVHNLLTMNVGIAMGQRLRGSGCRALSSDMRVRVTETGLYCYPDLTVVCGKPEMAPTTPPTLLNPTVIVEVLSESTAAFDKDAKFAHYRRRVSIEAVLFVSWPERRVEHYARGASGWTLTEAQGEEDLAIPSLRIVLPLGEVYEGMEEYLP